MPGVSGAASGSGAGSRGDAVSQSQSGAVLGRGAGPLRLVVMGTGPFAVPMFHTLRDQAARGPRDVVRDVVAVVTRPDRAPPGRTPPPNPMRQAATAAGLPILDPGNVNEPEAVAAIAALRPDLLVVCDYGRLLSAELLTAAPLGGINLHGSLLPRHRGAAPVQWTILSGDEQAGVSVFHMTPALDAGNVLAVRSTPVRPRETAAELERQLAELGGDAVLEAIDVLDAAAAAGTLAGVGTPQDPATATRAPRLAKTDGVIDWSWPAARIERLRRALEPWPRAATFFDRGDGQRQRLVIEDCRVADVAPAGFPGGGSPAAAVPAARRRPTGRRPRSRLPGSCPRAAGACRPRSFCGAARSTPDRGSARVTFPAADVRRPPASGPNTLHSGA
jgi:methionyl-tRNA formyltransferase